MKGWAMKKLVNIIIKHQAKKQKELQAKVCDGKPCVKACVYTWSCKNKDKYLEAEIKLAWYTTQKYRLRIISIITFIIAIISGITFTILTAIHKDNPWIILMYSLVVVVIMLFQLKTITKLAKGL